MGDFFNLYIKVMYPNRTRSAIAREAGINHDAFNDFVSKRSKKMRPHHEYKLCKWTGMEPNELYLDLDGKATPNSTLRHSG